MKRLDPFERDVREARATAVASVEETAATLNDLLGDRRWPRQVRTATDLADLTGINPKSAWMIFRAAQSSDLLAEAHLIPKRGAVSALVTAARRLGIADRRVERVRRAFDRFEEATRTIAGDRETFEQMAGSWAGSSELHSGVATCRQAFKANRLIWGLWSKASTMTLIGLPKGPGQTAADDIVLRGLYSLSASRHGTWDLYGSQVRPGRARAPLKCAVDSTGTLIPDYSSGAISQLDRRNVDGWELVSAELQPTGEVAQHTLLFGESLLAMPDSPTLLGKLDNGFPTETLMVDLVVPKARSPHLLRHHLGIEMGSVGMDHGQRELRSVPVQYSHSERVALDARLPEMPRYVELLTEVIRDSGHDIGDFELFRAACKYPPTGATLTLEIGFAD